MLTITEFVLERVGEEEAAVRTWMQLPLQRTPPRTTSDLSDVRDPAQLLEECEARRAADRRQIRALGRTRPETKSCVAWPPVMPTTPATTPIGHCDTANAALWQRVLPTITCGSSTTKR